MAGTQIWHHFHHTFSYFASFVWLSNLQSASNSDLLGPNRPKIRRSQGTLGLLASDNPIRQENKIVGRLLIRLHLTTIQYQTYNRFLKPTLNLLADLFWVCYGCQSQKRAQLWPLTSNGPLIVDTRWWKAIGEAKKGEEGGGKTWHSPVFLALSVSLVCRL